MFSRLCVPTDPNPRPASCENVELRNHTAMRISERGEGGRGGGGGRGSTNKADLKC